MRIFTILMTMLLLGILGGSSCMGEDLGVNEQFAQCNGAYSRGDYDLAVSCYHHLVDRHGYSSSLLYNLANSYAQQGDIGKAILNYERALQLQPNDPDILGNLQLVRKTSGLFTGDIPFGQRLFSILTIRQWSYLALGGLLFITALMLIITKRSISRPVRLSVQILSLLAIILGAAGAGYLHRISYPAVVIAGDSRLLISPFAGATSIGSIQQGRLVSPEKQYDSFVYLTDETGRKGWLPKDMIEYINPDKPKT